MGKLPEFLVPAGWNPLSSEPVEFFFPFLFRTARLKAGASTFWCKLWTGYCSTANVQIVLRVCKSFLSTLAYSRIQWYLAPICCKTTPPAHFKCYQRVERVFMLLDITVCRVAFVDHWKVLWMLIQKPSSTLPKVDNALRYVKHLLFAVYIFSFGTMICMFSMKDGIGRSAFFGRTTSPFKPFQASSTRWTRYWESSNRLLEERMCLSSITTAMLSVLTPRAALVLLALVYMNSSV